jgi:hypothetical protein
MVQQEIKYTHTELVEAVQRLQDLGEFDKEVEASKKAGEILNNALDRMERQIDTEVRQTVENVEPEKSGEGEVLSSKDAFDKGSEFKL